MLRSLRNICGFSVRDVDGEMHKPKDWLFDSSQWTVRYLRVDIGTFLAHRSVLVAPFGFDEIDELVSFVYLNVALNRVVVRQMLEDHRTRSHRWGNESCRRTGLPRNDAGLTTINTVVRMGSPHAFEADTLRDQQLFSWRRILGCTVQTLDAPIGRIIDLIAEDHNWTIRFLVVAVGGWWGRRKLLLRPDWVQDVVCRDSLVRLNLGTGAVCDAPVFKSSFLCNHEYQGELLDIYYGEEAGG